MSPLQSEGGAVHTSLQRGVGPLWDSSDGPGHGAPVCTPAALRLHRGQSGAGLHRADGRGLPAAPADTRLTAAPGDARSEREQAHQSHTEGAD